MDATELSGQIKVSLEAGQFATAHRLLLDAWKEVSEFGTFHSDVPEYADLWIKFKTRGYPFSLRAQWETARSDRVVMDIILRYIDNWNLVGTDGNPILLPDDGKPRTIELIDALDESLVGWLIRAFMRFWRSDLTEPRKN